jgi:hypothetical protein
VGFVDSRDDELDDSLEDATFRGTTFGEIRDGSTWEVPVERVDTEDGVARYEPTPEDREFVVELRHDTGENVEDCQ